MILGVLIMLYCRRFMTFVRVIEVDGRQQICTRDKVGQLSKKEYLLLEYF